MPGAEPEAEQTTGESQREGLNAGDKGADAARGQGAIRSINSIYIYVYQVVKDIASSVDKRGGKSGEQTEFPGRRRIGRPQADADR